MIASITELNGVKLQILFIEVWLSMDNAQSGKSRLKPLLHPTVCAHTS